MKKLTTILLLLTMAVTLSAQWMVVNGKYRIAGRTRLIHTQGWEPSVPPVSTCDNTWGNAEVFGSTTTIETRRAQSFVASEAGTIGSVSMYHSGGTGNFLLGVYSDVAGVPATRLGVSSSTAINSTAGWQTLDLISDVEVTSGQTIWLAWVFETNPGIWFEAGTPGRATSTETWSGGMPTSFGSSTTTGYIYSIYCCYTPEETSTTRPGHLLWYQNFDDESLNSSVSTTDAEGYMGDVYHAVYDFDNDYHEQVLNDGDGDYYFRGEWDDGSSGGSAGFQFEAGLREDEGFPDSLNNLVEIWQSCNVRFDANFTMSSYDGKMPLGLRGSYAFMDYEPADGWETYEDGFLVRKYFSADYPINNHRHLVYWPDMTADYGVKLNAWFEDWPSTTTRLYCDDEWHNVAWRLVLNTPGSSNGMLEYFHNEILVGRDSVWNYRTADSVYIDWAMWSWFPNSSYTITTEFGVDLDDMALFAFDDHDSTYTGLGEKTPNQGYVDIPGWPKGEDLTDWGKIIEPVSPVVDDSIFHVQLQQDFDVGRTAGSEWQNTELREDFNTLPYTGGMTDGGSEYCTIEIIDSDTCLRLWAEEGEWSNSDFTIQFDSVYLKDMYFTYDMKVRDGFIIHPRTPVSPADNINDYGGKLPGFQSSWAGGGGTVPPDETVDPLDGAWKRRSRWSYLGEGGMYGWDQANPPNYTSYVLTTGHDWWETADSACVGDDCYLIYDNVDWITYTMRVGMNTPGSANGILNIYVGDSCIYANSTIEWRGDAAVGTDFLSVSLWFGGVGTAVVDEYLDIDNMIAWKYEDDVPGSSDYPTVKSYQTANAVGDKIPIPSFAGQRTN